MHLIKTIPDVGSLIETKENELCFVLDIYDNFNFCAIDYETNNKTLFLTTNDIKEIIKVPKNVRFIWLKRVEKILNNSLENLK